MQEFVFVIEDDHIPSNLLTVIDLTVIDCCNVCAAE